MEQAAQDASNNLHRATIRSPTTDHPAKCGITTLIAYVKAFLLRDMGSARAWLGHTLPKPGRMRL